MAGNVLRFSPRVSQPQECRVYLRLACLGIDVRSLVEAAGYVGITAVVFCESGVLLGFFLPGDSLLFTAGFLAGRGVLDLRLLVVLCFLAAAAGDSVG